ncbi:hypothetical protein MUK42_15831, partial [Musa troglodytarum]
MADGLSLIPASVLRNLADKLYEKRKNAALEIEGIVKQLALAGEHEKISAVINLLTVDFACSPQANQRKGGLIGLAAATVGLAAEAAQHLEIFDALCKLSADADPNVQSAAHLLDRLIKINEFVKLGGEQLVPYYADILGAILPCISDKEEKIRVVARETNEELRAIRADPADGFNIDAILSIARRRGALIVRRLCVLLDAERVYRQFSLNLEQEEDLDFASVMVQSLREEDINAKFLVQLDKLIRLLETPIFAYLRLQ